MNARLAKKLRKLAKKDGIEYVHAIKEWPFNARWRYSWFILFGKMTKNKKG